MTTALLIIQLLPYALQGVEAAVALIKQLIDWGAAQNEFASELHIAQAAQITAEQEELSIEAATQKLMKPTPTAIAAGMATAQTEATKTTNPAS